VKNLPTEESHFTSVSQGRLGAILQASGPSRIMKIEVAGRKSSA